jgi:SAM-dependent methyltransferase
MGHFQSAAATQAWSGQPAGGLFLEPETGDAFGTILARCWADGAAPWSAVEITERDDGRIGAADAAHYFGGPDSWPATERQACDMARGHVLDVGCGAGRHALPLAAAGHEVTGLESSPGTAGVAAARGVQVVLGSVYDPPAALLGGFDTLLLAGALGLLGTPQRAPRFLDAAAALARPGAQLLGCSVDPYVTDLDEHLEYHQRNRERGRTPGQVTMRVRDSRTATPFFDWLLVSADELAGLATGTRWRLDAYDHDGPCCLARLTLH